MQYPSFPTDNLYKFLAIAGVLAILVSNYLTSVVMMSMQKMTADETKETLRYEESRLWEMIDDVRLDHDEKVERTRELENMKPSLDSRRVLVIEQLHQRLDEIRTEAETQINMLGRLESVGFFITPIGFILWWWKVQRHQDRILRNEATGKSNKVKKLKAYPL